MQGPLLIFSILILFLAITLSIKWYKERVPQAIPIAVRKNTGPEERRTHPRHPTTLRIKYKTLVEEGRGEGISWIKDISRGGMRLFMDKNLEKGTFLTLQIDLPFDREPVLAQSSVVWKEGDDAGVIFDEVKEGDLNRILDYVDQRTQLSSLTADK